MISHKDLEWIGDPFDAGRYYAYDPNFCYIYQQVSEPADGQETFYRAEYDPDWLLDGIDIWDVALRIEDWDAYSLHWGVSYDD
jgi:hypothetical protein